MIIEIEKAGDTPPWETHTPDCHRSLFTSPLPQQREWNLYSVSISMRFSLLITLAWCTRRIPYEGWGYDNGAIRLVRKGVECVINGWFLYQAKLWFTAVDWEAQQVSTHPLKECSWGWSIASKVFRVRTEMVTYEKANATKAPLTTMKSRMFHKSRK